MEQKKNHSLKTVVLSHQSYYSPRKSLIWFTRTSTSRPWTIAASSRDSIWDDGHPRQCIPALLRNSTGSAIFSQNTVVAELSPSPEKHSWRNTENWSPSQPFSSSHSYKIIPPFSSLNKRKVAVFLFLWSLPVSPVSHLLQRHWQTWRSPAS